jgi:hypothetical protein
MTSIKRNFFEASKHAAVAATYVATKKNSQQLK